MPRPPLRPAMQRATAVWVTVAAWAFCALATAPEALAHDRLVGTVPADGASVSAPHEVVLRFTEPLLAVGARASVSGPAGPVPGTVAAQGTSLTRSLDGAVAPGRYEVRWRVVSADGHPVSGRLSFTVAGGEGPATPSPSASASAASPAAPDATASSGSGLLVGGLVVLGALCTGVILRARRAGGSAGPDDSGQGRG